MATPSKSDETRQRILTAALALFEEIGFDEATIREIAQKAGVATGATYYYYASKDAIVMDFYDLASREMRPAIEEAIAGSKTLDGRLRALIRVKFDYFGAHRRAVRALLRHADPSHPLSPFSSDTAAIRQADFHLLTSLITDCGIGIPRDLAPHLPEVLWLYQMGIIFFWITDESPGQARSHKLLDLSARLIASLLRFASLPLTKPLRKPALEIIATVKGITI